MAVSARSVPRAPSPPPWTQSKLLVRAVAALIALSYLGSLATILRANHAWILRQLPDDALYYAEVGQRASRGEGFTFDGINPTDGFHPLWQWITTAVAWVFPDGDATLRALLVVGTTLGYVAVVILVRVGSRVVGPSAAVVGGLLAVRSSSFARGTTDLMEGAVVVLSIAILVAAVARFEEHGGRRVDGFLVGAALGLAALARLDLIPFLAILGLVLVVRARSVRLLGRLAVGGLVVFGPWFLWHLVTTGHLLTASGAVKQHRVDALVADEFGGRLSWAWFRHLVDEGLEYARWLADVALRSPLFDGPVSRLATLVLLATAVFGFVAWRRRWQAGAAPATSIDRSEARAAAFAVGAGLLLLAGKALFDLWFSFPWARLWYATPQAVVVPLVVGAFVWLGVDGLRERFGWAALVAVAALAVVALPWSARTIGESASTDRQTGRWLDETDRAVDWVLESGPDGRYGAFDAGLPGFRLDGAHPVVNLDGLINDWDHASLIFDGTSERELVRSAGVDVLINRMTDERLDALGCGEVLWESNPVPYTGTDGVFDDAPVSVLDVTGC